MVYQNTTAKEMKENGGISADTVSSIIDLLSEEEKLTDYVTAQGDVLVFNTEAWHKRAVAQYEDKLASLEAENAILESSEATEENTRKIAENNAMIGIYNALITGAAEATKEATAGMGDAYDKVSSSIDNISKMGRNVQVTYDAYQSMIDEDVRYAKSIQYVNGMLTINRDKYNEVTEAIIAETLAMAKAELQVKLLEGGYQDLVSRKDSLTSEEQQRLDNLNAEIMGYSVLTTELSNATTAYQRFLNYTDTSSTDRYNTAIKAYDIIDKTLHDKTSDLYGKVGTEQFKLAVNYVLGENVEINTAEFDRGLKLAERYLADESKNIDNFYDDLVKNGIIDSTTDILDSSILEISDKLGIGVELTMALLKELEDYSPTGFDWTPLFEGLDEETREKLEGMLGGIEGTASSSQEKAQTLSDTIQTIQNDVTTLNNTPVAVGTSNSVSNLGKVSTALSNVITKLVQIANMSQINVNVNTNTTTTSSASSSSTGSSLWGKWFGASAASGTHKAVGGKTLVGELGMETVVDPNENKWYTVGENGAQFVTLPKNAIVFNAQQTESLFGSGGTNTRGESMASGNAAASLFSTVTDIAKRVADGIITNVVAANAVTSALDFSFKNNANTVGAVPKPNAGNSGTKKSSGGGSGKSSNSSSSEKITDPFEELKKHYDELNDYFEHLIEHQVFLYKQAERGLDYQGMEASLQEQVKIYQDMMKSAQEGVAALQAKGAKDTDAALQEMEEAYWSAYNDLNSVLDQINQLYVNALTEKIDSVQNAYNNLSNAADEFAKYGGISVDTFQSLIANGVQYLSLLKNTDGQYVINTEGIRSLIAAQKEQLAIESALSYISQLREALTNNNTNAVQNLVSLTNQISDASWNQVYAQVALLKAMGLNDVQYAKVLENINALKEISGSVIADIANGAQDIADAYDDQEKALDKLLKYTQDLIEYETKQKVKAIEKQIEAYKHLIDLKKKSLQTTKDEASYEDSIAEKVKEIAKLQASIDQLSLDDSRNAIAERLTLMEKLADLQKELSEAQSSHAYDAQVEALDQMAEAYEESRQADIEALENSISSTEKLYQAAIARITDQWGTLYDELIDWNTEAGSVINSEITENWNLASEAILKYGSYVKALQAIQESRSSSSSSETDSGTNTVVASSLPKYHSGGVVGADDIDHSKEIVAVLEKGEIVVDDQKQESLYQIIDFQEELSKRLGSTIGSLGDMLSAIVFQNTPTQSFQHDIAENTSIVFNPSIHVEINSNGPLSSSDARMHGREVASTTLDVLKDSFTRRGITKLGGAKLSPA